MVLYFWSKENFNHARKSKNRTYLPMHHFPTLSPFNPWYKARNCNAAIIALKSRSLHLGQSKRGQQYRNVAQLQLVYSEFSRLFSDATSTANVVLETNAHFHRRAGRLDGIINVVRVMVRGIPTSISNPSNITIVVVIESVQNLNNSDDSDKNF